MNKLACRRVWLAADPMPSEKAQLRLARVQKQEVGPDADRLVNREEKQWRGRDVRPNHQSSVH